MAQNVTLSVKGEGNAAHGLGCPQRQLSFSHAAAFGVLEATLGAKPDGMAAKISCRGGKACWEKQKTPHQGQPWPWIQPQASKSQRTLF